MMFPQISLHNANGIHNAWKMMYSAASYIAPVPIRHARRCHPVQVYREIKGNRVKIDLKVCFTVFYFNLQKLDHGVGLPRQFCSRPIFGTLDHQRSLETHSPSPGFHLMFLYMVFVPVKTYFRAILFLGSQGARQ